jgi:hypothetical protein
MHATRSAPLHTATSVPRGKTTEYDGVATGAERGGWRKAPASEGAFTICKRTGYPAEDLLFLMTSLMAIDRPSDRRSPL